MSDTQLVMRSGTAIFIEDGQLRYEETGYIGPDALHVVEQSGGLKALMGMDYRTRLALHVRLLRLMSPHAPVAELTYAADGKELTPDTVTELHTMLHGLGSIVWESLSGRDTMAGVAAAHLRAGGGHKRTRESPGSANPRDIKLSRSSDEMSIDLTEGDE